METSRCAFPEQWVGAPAREVEEAHGKSPQTGWWRRLPGGSRSGAE